MATAYYGVKLSPNVIKTEEGYLVFKGAVIARTGFQSYKGNELPLDELQAQDIAVASDDIINVYRSPEEVFSPRTIGSFEGKPVTDLHPPELLDIDTVEQHACGHMQHVRKGDEPLPSGDWPLVADVFVTNKDLISKWEDGVRELSCGYNYHIKKEGNQILQVGIIGNHVAFVPNGRAGRHVKVLDAAPVAEQTKEKIRMSAEALRKLWQGMGFKAWAADAKPEEIADAIGTHANDSKPDAKDAVVDDKAAADKAARDRLHKLVDERFDSSMSEQESMAEQKKEDLEKLKALIGSDESFEEKEKDKEDEKEAQDEDPEADDEAVESEASPVIAEEDLPKPLVPSAVDAAFAAGRKAGLDAALKSLKPFVARSKDKALQGAFDTANKLANKSAITKNGGYSAVGQAAVARDSNAIAKSTNTEIERAAKADAAFAEAKARFFNKGK